MLKYIQDQKIDLSDKRILLAVSGGIDSVVMAHLFQKSGIEAGIAHCNFGLRGRESEEDEAFVRHLAEKLNFSFHSSRFDTKSYSQKKNISTQMAARELRYEWFSQLMKQAQYDFLSIAQHAGDNIETILLNLIRGTGMAGVRGILPVNGKIIRPLLFTDRDTISKYAEMQQIDWREDSSNSSDHYYRNQIRHHVMPVLKKINPSLEQNFRATSERLIAAGNLVNGLFEKWRAEIITTNDDLTYFSLTALLSIPEPTLFLSDMLQPYGFNYWQIKDIVSHLSSGSGKVFYSGDYQLTIDRKALILSKKSTIIQNIIIDSTTDQFEFSNKTFLLNRHQANVSTAETSASKVVIDSAKLNYPLVMRQWRQGDRFLPKGMKGKSKKVSDLFTDHKLSNPAKERTGILVNGNGEIIWVAGLRLDERYAASPDTKEILSISILPQN